VVGSSNLGIKFQLTTRALIADSEALTVDLDCNIQVSRMVAGQRLSHLQHVSG
jgi:hypothetical protein